MFDSHAHLNDPLLENTRGNLLKELKEKNINWLETSTDYQSFLKAKEISKASGCPVAAGFHPHEAEKFEKELFYEMLKQDVVAVGEIGIDLFYETPPLEVQIKVFKEQMAEALKRKLPVIVHQRRAVDVLTELLSDYAGVVVFHSFHGSKKLLKLGLEKKWYFSISGSISYRSTPWLKEIPDELFLIETDSPYLLPVSLKHQKMNTPLNLPVVAQEISKKTGKPAEYWLELGEKNAKKLFGI